MNLAQIIILGTTVTVLAGCGGGGDSGIAGSGATTFALQAGYQARIKAGAVDNYTLSGTCAGTATISTGAPTTATFEGVAGFAVAQTVTLNSTNCTPATNAVSATVYLNASYAPLGTSIPGMRYEKFLTAPPSLPVSVKVGDTAVLATLTVYADSTKATVTGQRVLSYVIETDGSSTSTALVNVIAKDYNAASQPLSTTQSRSRIAVDGTLTPTTIDIQNSTTNTNHLVLTKA